jgi:hypothetical protein
MSTISLLEVGSGVCVPFRPSLCILTRDCFLLDPLDFHMCIGVRERNVRSDHAAVGEMEVSVGLIGRACGGRLVAERDLERPLPRHR